MICGSGPSLYICVLSHSEGTVIRTPVMFTRISQDMGYSHALCDDEWNFRSN